MFGIFKKKNETVNSDLELKAIADGKVIDIENVPDPMFAQKLLGDGIGFVFEGSEIFAPCNGEITMIAETNHAFGIKAENGAEFLLHVGLDTVNLKGQGLSPKVAQGQKVKAGQLLLVIDRAFMAENQVELTTPLIMTEAEGYTMEKCNVENDVTKDSTVMIVKKN